MINKHNAKKSSYTLAVNKFADKTYEELSRYYLTNIRGFTTMNENGLFAKKANKDFVDWEAEGKV